jgi:hypothetical protein
MGQGITTGVRQPGGKITEDWIRTASLQCIERYIFWNAGKAREVSLFLWLAVQLSQGTRATKRSTAHTEY